MEFPAAIYFDTNIFRKIKKEFDSPEFQNLQKLCQELNISINVPEVVLQEWLFHHTSERAKKFIDKINSSYEELKSYVVSTSDISVEINETEILLKSRKDLIEKVNSSVINVLNTPKLEMDVLINRAVQKIRPFKSEDKGFRDTIILFTILEHAKSYKRGEHLLITNDSDFYHEDVYKTAREHEVKLILIKTIPDAIDHLQSFLKKAYKAIFMRRAKLFEDFLVSKQDDILEYINDNASFSDMFFSRELTTDRFFYKTIKKINSIELVEITKASAGFLEGDNREGWIKVSFVARLNFFVTVNISRSFFPPKIPIGEERESIQSISTSFMPGPDQEEVIIKDLDINGDVFVKDIDIFENLRITSLLTF